MSRRPLGFSALLISVIALSLLAAAPVSAGTRKVALGVAMRGSSSPATYDSFTQSVGRAPAIWMLWRNWLGDAQTAFPEGPIMDALAAHGTVPMITWQPADPAVLNKPKITYDKILDGQFDSYIRKFARAARDYRRPVILRFAHEMDGAWFPWGVNRFTNSPSKFNRMWRYVWNKFEANGATNVRWLWSPTGPCNRCPDLSTFFPGDRYVDYVGVTAFNWGSPSNSYERQTRPWSKWKSMLRTVTPGVEVLKQISSRPIIIAELGSTTNAPPRKSKAAWVRAGYPAVYNTHKRVKAIVYFNIDMRPPPDRHEDWRLVSPEGRPLAAYEALLDQARFQGRIS